MIIQKQYEYVSRVKNNNLRKQNSFERIVNSKFQYPKSIEQHSKDSNQSHHQQQQHCDTINFKSQIYFQEADKISQNSPIFEENSNPLNKLYLIEKQSEEHQNSSFAEQSNEQIGSVDDFNRTYATLKEGELLLIGTNTSNEQFNSYQNTQCDNSFLSSKWVRNSSYQSPMKYPGKALLVKREGDINSVVEIQNPNNVRKYLTNLKSHLIHRVKSSSQEPVLKTIFERIDNRLYKQRQAKYNPGFKEPFKAENILRIDIPEKNLGPTFQVRFRKREICEEQNVSLINDQTREQIEEEIFMQNELANFIKDKEANSKRNKWNLQYRLDPITRIPLQPNIIHQQNDYRAPIYDQTSFLTNEVFYDKEFQATSNPIKSEDKKHFMGYTFTHQFNTSSLPVQYRKLRSMSRNIPYNRGIFDITQTNQKYLNQSFY